MDGVNAPLPKSERISQMHTIIQERAKLIFHAVWHSCLKYLWKGKMMHDVMILKYNFLLLSMSKLIWKYSQISISRTRISRILRNSKRLSELNIHFDCFLKPFFGIGDFFTSPNYPKCKLFCTSGNLNL